MILTFNEEDAALEVGREQRRGANHGHKHGQIAANQPPLRLALCIKGTGSDELVP